MTATLTAPHMPGHELDPTKMPGHWLLVRMGKRVLRPGGLQLTEAMLADLAIAHPDQVVEFAPGMGLTTRRVLDAAPAEYVAVEADCDAAEGIRQLLDEGYRCQVGTAQNSGLDDASATVVFGEAYLTMQSDEHKQRIVDEAFRILHPGGRFGMHEIALCPDDASAQLQNEVRGDLTRSIHVGARPVTLAAWIGMLESAGFEVGTPHRAPMALLRPQRMLRDEGLLRSLRIAWNVLRNRDARQRVLAMRSVFERHAANMTAFCLVARKPA